VCEVREILHDLSQGVSPSTGLYQGWGLPEESWYIMAPAPGPWRSQSLFLGSEAVFGFFRDAVNIKHDVLGFDKVDIFVELYSCL
jgi:hypothetical protein